MRPIVGISVNYKDGTSRVADAYVEAVAKAGAVPVMLPVVSDEQAVIQVLSIVNGLVLTGGADIDPKYFGEEPIPELGEVIPARDTYDLLLIEHARRRQIPILAICRGIQILNVQMGGTLYQDIYAQRDGQPLCHDQGKTPRTQPTHAVCVNEGTKLAAIVGCNALNTNTFHHQALKDVAQGLVATAFTEDGICEAVEAPHYPMIGVQWHPENLAISGNKEHLALFEWLVAEAHLHHEAQRLHDGFVALDSHCDTPMVYTEGMDFGKRNPEALVDFVKMDEGRIDAVFMAAYIPQKELDEASTAKATRLAFDTLAMIHRQIANNAATAMLACSTDDIAEAKKMGKKAVVPVVENGYAIGNDLANVEKFYNLGVRYITLCHNGDNLICDSASRSQQTHGGVSNFGRQVIAEMNRLGMMVDLSHAAETSFWDALELSITPIICSHSSARALCDHPRNLSDNQLVALAKRGGVCQVCLYDGFLTKNDGTADVRTAVDHIDHIVRVAGIDHVGIGSDFDGGGAINGCQAENELVNITKELLRRGYSDSDIRKIWGENLLRVMRTCETHAKNAKK